MRGMAPGENKFHREIPKTEFSQQGRKGHRDQTIEKQEEREATEVEKLRTVWFHSKEYSVCSCYLMLKSFVFVAFAALL
jgi:hypothetical protein